MDDYLKTAHGRLVGEVLNNPPPKFATFNDADVFDHDAADHINKVAGALNNYICTFVRELEIHGVSISPKEYISPFSDALDDIVHELNNHAYAMREDAAEMVG